MDPSEGLAISGTLNREVLKTSQKTGTSEWEIYSKFGSHQGSNDASLFSSSLPVLPHEKLITDSCIGVHSIDDISSKLDELDVKDAIEELDLQGIGNLLPDEDELFDGILSDYNQCALPSLEQVEDCDLFSSGGGIELDADPMENVVLAIAKPSTTDGYVGNGNFSYNIANGIGSIAGEHPYGEHPSRTLFVRNINSNVEDSELRSLFEQYGDIRSMYTPCKHRGFVMISYYDIRHARSAMRALQDKPLRRRKLDIHFSIPKDNPSEKDLNQGTLVVFNLDPSVSNDDLRQIFGAFGEVKEIRETPHKKHHKFVEFYDVRAAEDALRSLNRSDIAGKRIKLEPSRPGGARRNLIQQLSPVDNEDMKNYRQQLGSPITNSPPGNWTHSPTWSSGNTVTVTHSSEFTSMNPSLVSNSAKIAPIGKEHHRTNRGDPLFSKNIHLLNGGPVLQSHSFPEHGSGIMQNLGSNSSIMPPRPPISPGTSGMGTLTGSQFLWGSPHPRPEFLRSPVWSIPTLGHTFSSDRQKQGFPYTNNRGSHLAASHHVGSAPSGIPFERKSSFFNDLADPSFPTPLSYGGKMVNPGILRGPINPVSSISTSDLENGSLGFRMSSPRSLEHVFGGNLPHVGHGQSFMEGFTERSRTPRADNSGIQSESKKQFQLDIEKIINGEDTRTTLMIKNIPNKYTYKMLLASIDEHHRGTYDFLYLPIDIKNKCNVGYAFINMVSPSHIVSFYQAFNGKRWEKFNSEKVASLAYARIQGKAALDAHFQNSSLMNEDRRYRPILFNSEGMEALDQECLQAYVVSSNAQQQGTVLGEEKVLEDRF